MIDVAFEHMTMDRFRDEVQPWLSENITLFNFQWPRRVVTFMDDDDATAAILKFGAKRMKSKLDIMIENEEES